MSPTVMETSGGLRKAAVLLISVGEEAGAELMRRLPPSTVRRLSEEIARVGLVPAQEAEATLQEFHDQITDRCYARGGAQFARRVLTDAFGSEADKILAPEVLQPVVENGLESLQKANPERLARLIQNENPQTIALILTAVPAQQAGALFLSLPEALRGDVATRMAGMEKISPAVLERIAQVIGVKLREGESIQRTSYGGLRAIAEILNNIDPGATETVLGRMAEVDPAKAEGVRECMFVFDDILGIAKDGIKALLGRIDRKQLTIALKGTSPELKNHFTQCMSQRGAEMLKEDMDALGPVRIKDVKSAQQQIVSTIRQLQAEGVIGSAGQSSDQYVV